MPLSVNSIFSDDFPVKYMRVACVFRHEFTTFITMPFGISTTARDMVRDACLMCHRKFNRALDPAKHDIAFLDDEGDGSASFAAIPPDATLSMVPRIGEALRRGTHVDVTLVPKRFTAVRSDEQSFGQQRTPSQQQDRRGRVGMVDISIVGSGHIPPYATAESASPSRHGAIAEPNAELEQRVALLEKELEESRRAVSDLSKQLSLSPLRAPLDDRSAPIFHNSTSLLGDSPSRRLLPATVFAPSPAIGGSDGPRWKFRVDEMLAGDDDGDNVSSDTVGNDADRHTIDEGTQASPEPRANPVYNRGIAETAPSPIRTTMCLGDVFASLPREDAEVAPADEATGRNVGHATKVEAADHTFTDRSPSLRTAGHSPSAGAVFVHPLLDPLGTPAPPGMLSRML